MEIKGQNVKRRYLKSKVKRRPSLFPGLRDNIDSTNLVMFKEKIFHFKKIDNNNNNNGAQIFPNNSCNEINQHEELHYLHYSICKTSECCNAEPSGYSNCKQRWERCGVRILEVKMCHLEQFTVSVLSHTRERSCSIMSTGLKDALYKIRDV